MIKAADPNPPLNLRAEPKADAALLGTIENGAFLDVKQEADGWFQVEAEPTGGQRVTAWVAANLTEHRCSTKTARLSFAAGKTGMVIADRFIGVGSHTYKVEASEGQRLSVAAQAGMTGIMPRVEDPSGRVLFDGQQDQESWSTKLVQSGDYQLVFESNFKGYAYEVYVEVK
jgi:Bacterial SH3 domain